MNHFYSIIDFFPLWDKRTDRYEVMTPENDFYLSVYYLCLCLLYKADCAVWFVLEPLL